MNDEAGAGVPEGFVLVPKGGRPPKTARDAAILMARHWRMHLLGESAKDADSWIVQQFDGLTEARHVRARIQIAEKTTFLHDCRFTFNEGVDLRKGKPALREFTERALRLDWLSIVQLPSNFNREACSVCAIGTGPGDQAKAFMWTAGMKQAGLAKLIPLEGGPPKLRKSDVDAAVEALRRSAASES